MKQITVFWTETCRYSASIEVPDDHPATVAAVAVELEIDECTETLDAKRELIEVTEYRVTGVEARR